MKEKAHFIYNRRYTSFSQTVKKKSDNIKAHLQRQFANNKILSKFLDPLDLFYVNKRESIRKDIFNETKEDNICTDIFLGEVNYFEALEIDDFDKYRYKLVSKFHKYHIFFNPKDLDDLKQTLSEVKENFNSISWGRLFHLDYSKNKTKHQDLFSTVTVSYIKTSESYFILKIKVKPSEIFNHLFRKIISERDVSTSTRCFNSFRNIIRTKKFSSHESISMSLKSDNIDNLLADLNYQVKQNLTKHFNGYFHASKTSEILPSIEYYEVLNMTTFNKDIDLNRKFETNRNEFYGLADNGIKIYMSDSSFHKRTLIKIVKETGHGKKEKSGNDLTNYDWVETLYLIESLSFPCVFQGILEGQFEKLNKLKRQIYDFVKDTNKSTFFNGFFFFINNKKYSSLKQTLTEILLTTKRFESEFTKENIYLYTKDFDLGNFQSQYENKNKEGKNLHIKIVDGLSRQIRSLDTKTKSTNEIFKTIEELNTYRTNLLLQVISLFIALLALIFTFDKAKNLVNDLINYLHSY